MDKDDDEDYMEHFREVEQQENAEEAERRKEKVGMAEFGTDEYYRNAAYILSSYRYPSEETQEKLEWLRDNRYL